MTERNIAAQVLDGLREVREHRAGKRTFRQAHLEDCPRRTAVILSCEIYGVGRYPRNTHFFDSWIYLSHLQCLK